MDEFFSESSFEIVHERCHARLIDTCSEGGGKYVLALVVLYYLCAYGLVVLIL